MYAANKPPDVMSNITNRELRSNLSYAHTLLTANHSGTLTTCEMLLKITVCRKLMGPEFFPIGMCKRTLCQLKHGQKFPI